MCTEATDKANMSDHVACSLKFTPPVRCAQGMGVFVTPAMPLLRTQIWLSLDNLCVRKKGGFMGVLVLAHIPTSSRLLAF